MRRTVLWLVVSIAVVGGCGADDGGSGGPSVVDAELGGRYDLDELVVVEPDGTPDDGPEPTGIPVGAAFEFEAEFGALTIETECGRLLGSFSLLDDGRAGITVAGGSSRDCSADAEQQQSALLGALGRVDAWSVTDGGLDLLSSDGDLVGLVR